MITLIALLAGFALGYTARHTRPLHRLDTWASEQVDRRARDLRDDPNQRRRPGWYAAQAVFAVWLLAALAIAPRRVVHAWRHRNDPPPGRSPAVTVAHVNREP